MGTGILGRAVFQAYRQAIASMFQQSFITSSALIERSGFFFQLY